VVKRSLDLVLALCLLVSLAPLLAVVMMAIRLESPGPALFWQERVGQFGRRFWLVKLRSMGVHAEADGQARWAEEDDPRVTRLGRWLRQLHIDELPQLWNILRGEMSFVGPRPERPEFVIQLEAEIPYYSERHHLRPGITGWAQINYPYAASLQDARAKLEFDLFYVKHAHFLLDILILLQTARVLIWRTGAR
jgi:lipopolysaccharide/colanic/teichoic acid biosynthesis glycosyltransferase